MENLKPKRNIIPLVILLLIVGIGAAAIAKPKTDSIDKTQNTIILTGGSTADAFCENAWGSVTGQVVGENKIPNVPNYKSDDHFCGNPNAKIIVVEYTDFECPFCKQFHSTMVKLVAESDGQIGWILRHYPIDELHSRARNEATASECAFEQAGETGFWKYVNKIFATTSSNNSLPPDMLPLIATDIGLDKTAFTACLSSDKFLSKISADEALGEDKGPIGTPNSRIIVGGKEVDELKGAVDFATLKAKTDLWMKVE